MLDLCLVSHEPVGMVMLVRWDPATWGLSFGSSILSANHRANGAGEYIGLASTDEWMSCRGWGLGRRLTEWYR